MRRSYKNRWHHKSFIGKNHPRKKHHRFYTTRDDNAPSSKIHFSILFSTCDAYPAPGAPCFIYSGRIVSKASSRSKKRTSFVLRCSQIANTMLTSSTTSIPPSLTTEPSRHHHGCFIVVPSHLLSFCPLLRRGPEGRQSLRAASPISHGFKAVTVKYPAMKIRS